MAVVVDGDVRAKSVAHVTDKVRDGLRRRDSERVDDDDLSRSSLHRCSIDVVEVGEVGTGPVHTEERDTNARLGCVSDRSLDALDHARP